jgi:hypothetical protein
MPRLQLKISNCISISFEHSTNVQCKVQIMKYLITHFSQAFSYTHSLKSKYFPQLPRLQDLQSTFFLQGEILSFTLFSIELIFRPREKRTVSK